MFHRYFLAALMLCSTASADPRLQWDRFVSIVSELAVTELPLVPSLAQRISDLRADKTACQEIQGFWRSAEGLKLAGVARPLATLFHRVATNESFAIALLETEWAALLRDLQMPFNQSAPRDTFESWMAVPPEIEALQSATAQLTERLEKMKSRFGWLKVRFFMYQSALSLTTFWWLTHHFPQYIPAGFWNLGKTAEITSVAGVLLIKNIAIFNAWWPKFDLAVGRKFVRRRYLALVDAIAEAIRISPNEMVGPLIELAKAKELRARVLEDATLEAFFRHREIPSVSQGLVTLALQSVEEGEMARATRILDALTKDTAPNAPIVSLAEQLQEAITSKTRLEQKLRTIRFRYTVRNVLFSIGLVGTSAVGLHFSDPSVITAAKVLGTQIVGLLGMGRLLRYFWFSHPTDKLREKLHTEIEELSAALEKLLATDAAGTLPIVTSIAIPDRHTHPFIGEAAVAAMERSANPLVVQAFRQLALMNVKKRGPASATADFLGRFFRGHTRCIDALRQILIDRNNPTSND
jgi:hypothetical protein